MYGWTWFLCFCFDINIGGGGVVIKLQKYTKHFCHVQNMGSIYGYRTVAGEQWWRKLETLSLCTCVCVCVSMYVYNTT